MNYILGQDLGSQQDPSALVVISQDVKPHPLRPGETESVYELMGCKIWQLKTDYLFIAREVADTVERPPLSSPPLAFDVTGNIAYWDILRSLEPACDLRPIWITGGNTANEVDNSRINVGKVELLRAMIGIFASGRLIIRASAYADVLTRQIQSLTRKISTARNEQIDIPRDGTGHGDLAMACALALWIAERTCIGWDGSLGTPTERGILGKCPRGTFPTDPELREWRGEAPKPWGERRLDRDKPVPENEVPWEHRQW